ncbi:glycosyltransferase family 4 protein [Patescibacteria group bacterium]|nr:glycosyltransferase family 4 protein [Patescibacteria group bacterium]
MKKDNKKTKIRILETPIRFHPYIGGVENHVYYLAKQLTKLNYDILVVCANETESKEEEIIENNISVKRLSYKFKVANTNISSSLPSVLWKTDFDIGHAHMPTPWTADLTVLIAKLKGKRSVLTIHNDMDKPDVVGKIITWVYLHTFFQLTLLLTNKIIIVNPEWRTAFKNTRRLLNRFKNKIVTIPNGIDTDFFKPSLAKSTGNTILFVSILDEHHRFKGFEYLLDAMVRIQSEIPNIKLIVVGEGILVSEYREKAAALGLEKVIEFHGPKTQEELVSYYQNSKVFVLPSIEIEGFGIVLLEAMASELAVVTTDVAGITKDIEKHRTGYVIPPADSVKLAEAIIRILKNTDERNSMGQRGRRLMTEQYSWQQIASDVSQVFKDLS